MSEEGEEAARTSSSRAEARLPRRAAVFVAGLILIVSGGVVVVVSCLNAIRPTGIVLHHSAVPYPPDGSPVDVRLLDEVHRQRGFGAFYWGRFYHVGYHYVILPDGEVQSGRPERCRGAHAEGYNSYIGICLVGGFSSGGNADGEEGPREPTPAQTRSLLELTARLRKSYGIPPERVVKHRDVNPNTECPGDRFLLGQIKEQFP